MADLGWKVVVDWTDAFASGDLNSLASGSHKMSTKSDPQLEITTAGLAIEFEVYMGGSMTTTAGAALIVTAVSRMSDGTNWPTDLTNNNGVPPGNYPSAAIQFYVGTVNPHRQQTRPVPIWPGYYRFNAQNRLGNNMPSSGNMVRYRILTQTVG
jgi:hypothetical protein